MLVFTLNLVFKFIHFWCIKEFNFCLDFDMQKHCLSRSRFQIAEFHNIAMRSNDVWLARMTTMFWLLQMRMIMSNTRNWPISWISVKTAVGVPDSSVSYATCQSSKQCCISKNICLLAKYQANHVKFDMWLKFNQRTSGPVNAHLTPGPGIYFNVFIYVYSPRAGADNPLGTNFDVIKKPLSLCPFVASLKKEIWFYTHY